MCELSEVFPLKITGKSIPDEFVIRGEILMPRAVFNRLNEERIKAELTRLPTREMLRQALLSFSIQESWHQDRLIVWSISFWLEESHTTITTIILKRLLDGDSRVAESIRLCKNIDEVLQFISFWNQSVKTFIRYRRCSY